jgi:hypothetical protein
MANIALNKTADASNFMFPYSPAKGVDGNLTPLSRWVGSSPLPPEPAIPNPVWYRIDLGAFYWINRWVVKQMGSVGWSANYNLTDYKLQGSLDNANWFDIDSVTNNSANQTDRTCTITKVRWARIYVTKGLRGNTNFASIEELELYPADPTSAKLSGLAISTGTLTPTFGGTTYAYTASVGYDTTSMTVTATVEDSRATIKVNGTTATSGQPFTVNNLAVGPNTITVQVTPYIGDPQNYVITVTRASSSYLSNVTGFTNLNPTFSRNVFSYTASVDNGVSSIKIVPTAEDANAAITVNGTAVQSGKKSQSIPINVGSNTVNVMVTSVTGSVQTIYVFTVSRQQ